MLRAKVRCVSHAEALDRPFSRKNSALGVATLNYGGFSTLCNTNLAFRKTHNHGFSLFLLRCLQERVFLISSPHLVQVPPICCQRGVWRLRVTHRPGLNPLILGSPSSEERPLVGCVVCLSLCRPQ